MALKALIVFAMLMATSFAFANSSHSDSLTNQLDALILTQALKHQAAGFTVGVSLKGKTVLNKGYGIANIETGRPADSSTVYSIGSMTKQFTAAAILQLVDSGAIKLDQDIHDIVSEYPAHQTPETILSLLSHTSGIPDYFPTDDADKSIFKPISEANMIARFAKTPLDFSPGSNFAYSNSNFYLLGIAIERVSGESYMDYLRDHIFKPLGLGIVECGDPSVVAKMAQGYLPDKNGKLAATNDMDMSWAFSAGNLCATADDILKWNAALHHGQVLKDRTYATMTSAVIMTDGTPTTYGAGLFVDEFEGHRHFEHGGDTLTFASQEAYYPDDDLSVVILTNTEGRFDRYGLEREIGREVLNLPPQAFPKVTIPSALDSQIVGLYDVPGRSVLGTNPYTISASSDNATLSVAGAPYPLTYQGNGRFQFGPSYEDVSLVFPDTSSEEPFFEIFLHEMLVGRGMRTMQNATPKMGSTTLR